MTLRDVFWSIVTGVVLASLFLGVYHYSNTVIATVSILIVVAALLFSFVSLHNQKPGTATVWEMFSKYACTTLQSSKHHFDANGKVVYGPGPKKTTGGCWLMWRVPHTGYIFYVAGFVRPVPYSEYNENDGFGEGVYIFLRQQARTISLSKAETKAGSGVGARSIPVDIKAVYLLRPEDPEAFFYDSDKDVIKKTDEQMQAVLRDIAYAKTPEELQLLKSNSAETWNWIESNCQGSLEIIRGWGIDVLPNNLSLTDLSFQRDDQEAQAEAQREDWRAQGEARRVLRPALEALALSMGLGGADKVIEELQKTDEGRSLLREITIRAGEAAIDRKKAEAGVAVFDIKGVDKLIAVVKELLSKIGGAS